MSGPCGVDFTYQCQGHITHLYNLKFFKKIMLICIKQSNFYILNKNVTIDSTIQRTGFLVVQKDGK